MEWFNNYIEPEVKFDPLSFQDHISSYKSNIEYGPNEKLTSSRDTFQTLLSMSHDSLFHDLLDQPTSTLKYVQPLVSIINHRRGVCISHVEEKSG